VAVLDGLSDGDCVCVCDVVLDTVTDADIVVDCDADVDGVTVGDGVGEGEGDTHVSALTATLSMARCGLLFPKEASRLPTNDSVKLLPSYNTEKSTVRL
jgi:hypothetical protein